jgi:hypothetical protein
VAEDRHLRAVAELDLAPGDVAARASFRELARAVLEVRLGLEHLEHAPGADPRAGDEAPALRDLVDRVVELRQVRDEDDELTQRQRPRHHRARPGVDDGRRARRDHRVDAARIEGLPRIEAERRAEARPARAHEPAMLLLLLGEGLDDLHRRHRPLDHRVDPGVRVAHLGRHLADLAVEERDEDEERRDDDEGEERERRVERREDPQHPAEQHHRREDRQEAVHQHGLDGEAVRRHPIHEVAHLLPRVEGEREALEVAVERAAHVVHHALADADRGAVVPERQRAADRMDEHDAEARREEQRAGAPAADDGEVELLPAEHVVDDDLERPRLQQLEPGDQEDLRQRHAEGPAMRPEIGQQLQEEHRGPFPLPSREREIFTSRPGAASRSAAGRARSARAAGARPASPPSR